MSEPLLHIALHQPLIPQNTGNIGRLAVGAGARLHLIHPLGFQTDQRAVRRAGLDYWKFVDCVEHPSFEDFRASLPEATRIFCFSTRAERYYTEPEYRAGDCLLFGGEVLGLPQAIVDQAGGQAVRIPLRSKNVRSLNLANSAAIATSEVLRQLGFPDTTAPRPRLD